MSPKEDSPKYITVNHAFYTVSGLVYAGLECPHEKPALGTRLVAPDNNYWTIKRPVSFSRSTGERLQRGQAALNIFFYELIPIGHTGKPMDGIQLLVK